jgi:hypothetical protein
MVTNRVDGDGCALLFQRGLVYGGLGLFRPWRGVKAEGWSRVAVERIRGGQECCLAR